MAKTKVIYRKAKSKGRRRPRMTIPMAVVGGFVPTAIGVWARRENPTEIGAFLQRGWTGVEPSTGKFNLANLRLGAVPVLAGFIVHILASKFGVNRAIARAGIPLIRI